MKTKQIKFNQSLHRLKRTLSLWSSSCLALLALSLSSEAQYTGPTPYPSCSGTSSTFDATISAKHYVWTFEDVAADFSISSLPAVTNVYYGNPLNVPGYVTMDFDDCGWVSFTTNYSANEIIRLDYGTSPLNPPTATSLGSGFGTGNRLEGIDIIKDDGGTWYGFAVNNTQLIRWQFSNNELTGAPINVTVMNFPGTLAYPLQLGIRKFDDIDEYIGFTANLNGGITRIDFGSSLGSTPTLTTLASTGTLKACNFVLHKEDGTWHMLTTNLSTHTVSRIIFNGIQDNTPSVSNMGNLGNHLQLPRGIFLLPQCLGGQLYGYILNEDGAFIKLDFNGSIWNTPSTTNLGSFSGDNNHALVFPFGGSLYALVPDFTAHSIRRLKLLDFPAPNRIDYYSSSFSYTFTHLPSPYKDIRFYADLGSPMGTESACMPVAVFPCAPFQSSAPISDSFSRQSQDHTLFQNSPNPFESYTTINYHIGTMENVAYILIQDALGKEVARYTIHTTGNGKIELNWNSLSPGVYYYSLIVDEQKMDTKKMAFSKNNPVNKN